MWNKVGSTISAGTIPTPKTLATNIKKVSGYSHNISVPYLNTIYFTKDAVVCGSGDVSI
jgi:hypothetical protein